MLNDRIMHLNKKSISHNFYDFVVYLDSLQNKRLVIGLSEARTNEDFERNYKGVLITFHGYLKKEKVVMTA